MSDDSPCFDDQGRLIAPRFDDVYFSAEDGLAETRHVFLQGNDLADRFASLRPARAFTIGETGFGTGLNFLAAWQLFDQYAPADARLEFVSVEGLPLSNQMMLRALSPWPELEAQRVALLQQWGPIWPGMHRFRFADGRVRLTVLVDDAPDALASIDASVDAWFLDGFAPARNPAMWSADVLQEVARLSANDATLATYTAAGVVRRGLASAGFEIEKRPGFGTKRDMTAGRYAGGRGSCRAEDHHDSPARQEPRPPGEKRGGHPRPPSADARSVIVIGGSLAGSFVARSLAERGCSVTVIERQALNAGLLPALMPRVAVLQPKINHADDPAGRWLREGFAFALRRIESDPILQAKACWHRSGTFHAAHDERSQRRIVRFVKQFEATGLCRWIESTQTKQELGVDLAVGGVVVESGGTLLPAGLCKGLLDHPNIEVRDAVAVQALHRHGGRWIIQADGSNKAAHADCIVIANAVDARTLRQTKHLPLQPIRGQVSTFRSPSEVGMLRHLKRPLFYGSYVIPAEVDGQLTIGASFVPGDQDPRWRRAEHEACCDKLAKLLPEDAARFKSIEHSSGWVGARTATPNHRCYAEQVEPGLFVSLGHGSHGIASAAAAGEHLASLFAGDVRARDTR